MRIHVLGCLLLFLLAGMSPVNGQVSDQKLTQNGLEDLDTRTARIQLEDALQQLENKFNVSFVYESGLLDGRLVSPEYVRESDNFGKELQKLLQQFNLRYTKLNERTFIIEPVYEEQTTSEQAAHMVEGVVTDAQTGDVMPGVNIAVKGTTMGTSSNAKGQYSLDVPAANDTLVFSFIGYQTKEVPVQGRNQIDVVLQPTTIAGEELVVVGYGTQRKESIVAGVSQVSEQDLERAGDVPNLGMALTGKLPG